MTGTAFQSDIEPVIYETIIGNQLMSLIIPKNDVCRPCALDHALLSLHYKN